MLGSTVRFGTYTIEDGLLEVVLLDQILEQPLPRDLRLLAQISAVQPKLIESEVYQSILIASAEVCLQLGEVRAPVMEDDILAVHDGLSFDI